MVDMQAMVTELSSKEYTCAQIIVMGGLRLMGRHNPDLVRAAAGLALGVGNTGNICGALAGGLCLLCMHTAKGMDSELAHEQVLVLEEELVDRFREHCCHNGSILCDDILGEEPGTEAGMQSKRCHQLVTWVWKECLNILAEYAIDPTRGRPLQ